MLDPVDREHPLAVAEFLASEFLVPTHTLLAGLLLGGAGLFGDTGLFGGKFLYDGEFIHHRSFLSVA